MSIFKFYKSLTCLLGSMLFATNFSFGMDRSHSFSNLNIPIVESPIKEMIPNGVNPLGIWYQYGRKINNIELLHITSLERKMLDLKNSNKPLITRLNTPKKQGTHETICRMCNYAMKGENGGFIWASDMSGVVYYVCGEKCRNKFIKEIHKISNASSEVYSYDDPCYVCLGNSLDSGYAVYPCGHCTCPSCCCALLQSQHGTTCPLCKRNSSKPIIFYTSIKDYAKNIKNYAKIKQNKL